MIPYGHQSINQDDIDAVINVLKSDFLTQGTEVPEFEKAICDYTGCNYAIAVNSGTSALHLACLALGLKEGDMLWSSPITFVASTNCARYCGANVDFVDIDRETFTISIPALKDKLEDAEKKGSLPKVIVAVHLGGVSCHMREIKSLADQYGVKIIEDACHAIGGRYELGKTGSCQYSDISIFSFHPVKTITTGEGGMATTNDLQLAEIMSSLRTHGITRDENRMEKKTDGAWYYEQFALGFNYRMSDIQAALGSSQLKRLDSFVSKRHELAETYNKLLSELPLSIQKDPVYSYSGLHLYLIRLDLETIKKTKIEIFNKMREAEIGVNIHYIPVHLQPYYKKLGFKTGDFPEAESYYREALTLPLYPELEEKEMQEIVVALTNAIN